VKQFRILRTHKETTIASALTTRLQILAELKQRLESQHPDDEFCIVDSMGNPVQIEDFVIASMSAKERKEASYKELVQKRLKNCV
jgi:hypothetical protein